MRPAARGWTLTLDRVLFGCGAFVLAIQIVVVASAGATAGATGRGLLVAVAALDVALIGLCEYGFCVGRRRLAAVVASIVAAIALVCAVLASAEGGLRLFAVELVPTNAVQALQIVAIAFVVRPVVASALVAVTGPIFVAVQLGFADVPAWEAIDGWVLPASSSCVIIVAFAALRRGAVRADDLAARARSASVDAAASASREAAANEARRVVHDEVVTALRAVELDLPRHDVQRSVQAALARLDGSDRPTHEVNSPPSRWLEQLVATAPVEVAVRGTAWRLVPPARVVDAFTAAAAEALRNVGRHAGVETADLVVGGDDDRCSLQVRDHGRGLAPGAPQGFGIAESIVNRMREVGGAAEVRSGHGGTSVELTWPAVDVDAAHRDDRRSPVDFERRRTYLLVVAAPIIANLYLALRHPGAIPAAGVAVAVACSGLLIVAALLVRGRPARTAETLALAAAACALVWTGLEIAPDGALLSVESWIIGFAAVGLAVVAFESPPMLAAATAAGEVGTVVAFAARDPDVGAIAPIGAIVTPMVVVGLGIAMGVGLRRGRELIARNEALLAAHADDEAWRAGAEYARRTHLAHLRTEVVPFLRKVLDDPESDPRPTARLLGELCRDDLYLDRPLPPASRRQIHRARERGVSVTIRAGSDRRSFPDGVWPVFDHVLDVAVPGTIVTATPPRRDGDPARVVIVPALADPIAGGATDGFRTTFTVSSEPATSADQPGPGEMPA